MLREFDSLLGAGSVATLALQLLQAPVFHGFTASVFVQGPGAINLDELADSLNGGVVRVVDEEDDSPSNQSAAAQTEILAHVACADEMESECKDIWLWMAADNLRLSAHHAAACAAELMALRPSGNLQ
jgi:aspartate-semialdehyde dehydrogenase